MDNVWDTIHQIRLHNAHTYQDMYSMDEYIVHIAPAFIAAPAPECGHPECWFIWYMCEHYPGAHSSELN